MISNFMNDLIDIGVAGFRVDAAMHMFPGILLWNLNGDQTFPHGLDALPKQIFRKISSRLELPRVIEVERLQNSSTLEGDRERDSQRPIN